MNCILGIGGGTCSSVGQQQHDKTLQQAVQRGDPEMENKLNRFLRHCIDLEQWNPILSIHDQGAGGMANVITELVEPYGAIINLRGVNIGDKTLSPSEIWIAESQEIVYILVNHANLNMIKQLAQRANIPTAIVGFVTDDDIVSVYDKEANRNDLFPVWIHNQTINSTERKKYKMMDRNITTNPFNSGLLLNFNITKCVKKVFKDLNVGSKRFLTTKVDRSVTGTIAQQQCVGPLETPISDFSMIAHSFWKDDKNHFRGAVMAVGEQPFKGFRTPKTMVRMTVGEVLTNLVFANISKFEDIKLSGNWMWPAKFPLENKTIKEAVIELKTILKSLGIAIDGGKDSLSMYTKTNNDNIIKAPETLVLTAYVTSPDIRIKATPDLKQPGNILMFVGISSDNNLGGSILAKVLQLKECGFGPVWLSSSSFKHWFIHMQQLLKKGIILSGHDRSDGGLITTICEMAMGGNLGVDINIQNTLYNPIECLFSEGVGVVIEVKKKHVKLVTDYFFLTHCYVIGTVTNRQKVEIRMNDAIIFKQPLYILRQWWEHTSFQMQLEQTTHSCVKQEQLCLTKRNIKQNPRWNITDLHIKQLKKWTGPYLPLKGNPRVAVIREEGVNGDEEMKAAFIYAGFQVWDVTMEDLLSKSITLNLFRGIAFPGGFSYSDVFGASKGWATIIQQNSYLHDQFEHFKTQRSDTFSLGVCNGCQLMSRLGWIDGQFITNDSGRFESRFSLVTIQSSPAIMLKDMEYSTLGIWVAHGEGKYIKPSASSSSMVTMQYVDYFNNITEQYPFNPNGSKEGITGLCDKTGRHLAMMPHPERCFLKWQMQWMPPSYKNSYDSELSPWALMFRNAYLWTIKT